MAFDARIVTMGATAILSACSVAADTSPPVVDRRDGSVKATMSSGAVGAGTGGTNSVIAGTGGDPGSTGSAGSAGGNETAGNGSQPIEAEAPPVCTLPQYTHVSTFGAIFDGWAVATNSNFSLLTDIDGGSVVVLDAADGSPTNGSVKITIPFAAPNQQLLFAQSLPASINLTGTIVSARIKLDSGLNTSPQHSGQAFLVVKSTSSYLYAPAPPVNLDSSAGWTTLTLDGDTPVPAVGGYLPCDIREIDVVVQTGDMGTYIPAVVHIDTIAVTSRTPGDAGSDATANAPD